MEKEKDISNDLFFKTKLQIIKDYKCNKNKDIFSESCIYAIAHNCYPLFSHIEEIDRYKDNFEINKDYIYKVAQYLDIHDLNNDYKSYYELENDFGGRASRYKLYVCLRYIFLDHRFNEKLWTNLLKDGFCPIELKSIIEPFSDKDMIL